MKDKIIKNWFERLRKDSLSICKNEKECENLKRFFSFMKKRLVQYPFIERWHALSVLENIIKITKGKDKGDICILAPSALIHDIHEEQHGIHNILGSKEAEKILKKINYPEIKIKEIKQIIIDHNRTNLSNNISTNLKIFKDADILSNWEHIGNLRIAIYSLKFDNGKLLKDIIDNPEKFIKHRKSLLFTNSARKIWTRDYEKSVFFIFKFLKRLK